MANFRLVQYGTLYRPALWVSLLLLVLPTASFVPRTGTASDRLALFEYVVRKTLERTAWSPYTQGNPGHNFKQQAEKLRTEFIEADTDQKLFYALVKLSNLRRDRHLLVHPIPEGLRQKEFLLEAGIRFQADLSHLDRPFFFVSNFAHNMNQPTSILPAIGDKLVAINGIPLDTYVQMLKPYLRSSPQVSLWWEIARIISSKDWRVGPELYRDTVDFTLMSASGKVHVVRLPYVRPEKIEWIRNEQDSYPGFKQELDSSSYTLYLPINKRRVVLIAWKGFYGSAPKDIEGLLLYAQKHSLLDYNLIFDATHSVGGSRGAYIMAHLFSRPFQVTRGNLRLSDITPKFVEWVYKQVELGKVGNASDGGKRLLNWLETDVMEAYSAGQPYSAKVPFKLADLPKDTDQMQPAPIHFRGQVVIWVSPRNGSHLDQFAAMIVDNKLAHTMGMPAAGYSNTWEWSEILRFPRTGRPVALFMWSIGQTFRPNGEILEANPARVDDFFPPTQENFINYYPLLLERSYAWLDQRTAPQRKER